MAIKKILLQKSIEGTLYDIYTKTAADIVEYTKGSGQEATTTTVAAELASLANQLDGVITGSQVDTKIKAAIDDLIGLADGETLNTAYDTIKEISDYLVNHGSVVSGFTSDISGLKSDVGTASSGSGQGAVAATGLHKDVEELQAKVQSLESVGGTNVAKDENTVNGHLKLNGVDTTVYDDSALWTQVGTSDTAAGSLRKRVSDLESVGATKVEASTNNGKVKVNGSDITVYDDSTLWTQVGTSDKAGLRKKVADAVADITTLKNTAANKTEKGTANGTIKNDGGSDIVIYDDSNLWTVIGSSDAAGLRKKVADLETSVGKPKDGSTEPTGLYKEIADLKTTQASNAVAAATNNGYIKVGSTDNAVKVYDDSDLWTQVGTSDTAAGSLRKRVSDLEAIDAAHIEVVSASPAGSAQANTLYFVEIA